MLTCVTCDIHMWQKFSTCDCHIRTHICTHMYDMIVLTHVHTHTPYLVADTGTVHCHNGVMFLKDAQVLKLEGEKE